MRQRLAASSDVATNTATHSQELNGRRKLVHDDSKIFRFLINRYSLKRCIVIIIIIFTRKLMIIESRRRNMRLFNLSLMIEIRNSFISFRIPKKRHR